MKKELLKLLLNKYNSEHYSPLEQYALYSLMEKVEQNTLTKFERELIVEEFLFDYLIFDKVSGEPLEATIRTEAIIDFLLYK